MDKKHCLGCEEDFYNDKNPLGSKVCWSLQDAKLIMRKRVGINERPPWKRKPEKLPDCYRQKGYVFIRWNRMGWEDMETFQRRRK